VGDRAQKPHCEGEAEAEDRGPVEEFANATSATTLGDAGEDEHGGLPSVEQHPGSAPLPVGQETLALLTALTGLEASLGTHSQGLAYPRPQARTLGRERPRAGRGSAEGATAEGPDLADPRTDLFDLDRREHPLRSTACRRRRLALERAGPKRPRRGSCYRPPPAGL